MANRKRLRVGAAFVLSLASLGPALADGYGQVTLVNQTSATIDMYYDGNYGCRALNGLTCTTQVPSGDHSLTATTTDGRNAGPEPITLDSGGSFTWTLTESAN